MHRFLSDSEFTVGQVILLEADQSHHIAKVLRLEAGEVVGLINGRGLLGTAVLKQVRPKAVEVQVQDRTQGAAPSQIQLCFGLTKGQALDFTFHRATELGVGAFQPLVTRFSSPNKGWNPARWLSVVTEVCKQCEELHFPQVSAPLALEDWLGQRDSSRLLVLCDENARTGETLPKSQGLDLVVGAEGGFHPDEVALLREKGAVLMGLGKNRLRAETAAMVALTLAKKHIAEI